MKEESKHELAICLVDDHKIVREGLKSLLIQEKIATNIIEADNGLEFLQLLEYHKFDLVLMDISMPVMNGVDATKVALEKYPDIKVLVLTMYDDQKYFSRFIEIGAKGFLLKTSGKRELEHAIRTVLDNDNYFSSKLLQNMILKSKLEKEKNKNLQNLEFTDREMEVLEHLCNGFSTTEIAEKLFLSARTVETHRSNLLSKTSTKNTVNLVMFAIKNKIINIRQE